MDSWGDQVSGKLKKHYDSVADLFQTHIDGLISRKTNPASGANIIAQIHSDRCLKREEDKGKTRNGGRHCKGDRKSSVEAARFRARSEGKKRVHQGPKPSEERTTQRGGD